MKDYFALACAERRRKKDGKFLEEFADFYRKFNFFARSPAALTRIPNACEWSFATDRKNEKFLHFLPAKGKKCFQKLWQSFPKIRIFWSALLQNTIFSRGIRRINKN